MKLGHTPRVKHAGLCRNVVDSLSSQGHCIHPVQPPAVPSEKPRVPWWLWPNVLSLDAPLVAVLWQEALARAHHVKLLPGCDLALGLTVWLIYIVDRVVDGFQKVPGQVLSPRHAFYRDHRALVIGLVIPGLTLWLLYLALAVIPSGILWRGLAQSILVGIYLLHYSVHRSRPVLFSLSSMVLSGAALAVLILFPLPRPVQILYGMMLALLFLQPVVGRQSSIPKEFICGYLFALGCGLSVRFLSLDEYAGPFSLETLLLALLFALNCVAISCYERKTDRVFDPGAIFQLWPGIARMYPLLLLTLAALTIFAFRHALSRELLAFSGAVLFSTLLLGALHLFSRRITPDLARVLADAALVVPLVVVFVPA